MNYLTAPHPTCGPHKTIRATTVIIAIAVSFSIGFGTSSYLSIDRANQTAKNEKFDREELQSARDELAKEREIYNRTKEARDKILRVLGLPRDDDDDPLHLFDNQ